MRAGTKGAERNMGQDVQSIAPRKRWLERLKTGLRPDNPTRTRGIEGRDSVIGNELIKNGRLRPKRKQTSHTGHSNRTGGEGQNKNRGIRSWLKRGRGARQGVKGSISSGSHCGKKRRKRKKVRRSCNKNSATKDRGTAQLRVQCK